MTADIHEAAKTAKSTVIVAVASAAVTLIIYAVLVAVHPTTPPAPAPVRCALV